MGEVLMFPQKKRLPKGIEDEVHRIAKEYVEVLYAALTLLRGDEPNFDDFDEVNEMVALAYTEGLEKAIDELEKSPSN